MKNKQLRTLAPLQTPSFFAKAGEDSVPIEPLWDIDVKRMARLDAIQGQVTTIVSGGEALLYGPRGEVLMRKSPVDFNGSTWNKFVSGTYDFSPMYQPVDLGLPTVPASPSEVTSLPESEPLSLAVRPASDPRNDVASTAAPIKRSRNEDNATRARAWSGGIFNWFEAILPPRVTKEEIGDALEFLARPGISSTQIYIKTFSTVLFLIMNSLREVTSSLWGRRAA